MTRYPWVILHHDGVRQYARVPTDNGAEYTDLICHNLVVKDVGEDVTFRSKDLNFVCVRENVQTQLTIKSV